MEIKKVATDNRGDVHAFEVGEKTHTLVRFSPDTYRGGHFHKSDQWHVCLSGLLLVKMTNPENGLTDVRVMKEGDSLLIPRGIAHLFKSLEGEAMLAESRVGEYEATDYEPYRILARPK